MKNAIKDYIAYSSMNKIIFEVGVFLFVATLPLSSKINTIMLWLFLAGSLQYVPWRNRIANFKKNKVLLFTIITLYLTFFITLLYTENISYGLRRIEKTLTLVLIPLFVLTHNKTDFDLKKLFSALGIGLYILIIICWSAVFYSIYNNPTPWVQIKYFFEWIYSSWNLVLPVNGHPSYIGILIVIFIAALLKGAMFVGFRKNIIKTALILVPLFIFLLQTSSRIALIVLFCFLFIYFMKSFTLKSLAKIGLTIAILSILTYQFDFLGNKFDKIFDSKGNIKFERYQRWTNILKTINQQGDTFIGVGYGDASEIYETAYLKGKHYKALEENYNAHNQFIEFLVGAGIIGLALFIYLFMLFAFKTKLDGVALHLFIALLLFCFSESILDRSQGVFIFSFLLSVIYLSKQKTINIKTNNEA